MADMAGGLAAGSFNKNFSPKAASRVTPIYPYSGQKKSKGIGGTYRQVISNCSALLPRQKALTVSYMSDNF